MEQPEYLGESLLHLHRHRAPITATRPTGMATQATDILPISILLTDIRATHHRATDTQAIRLVPVTSLPRPMDTTAMRGTQLIPVPWAMDHLGTWDIRLTLARRATNIRAIRLIRPRLVPVLDIPSMVIPAITLQRVGRLGPITRSNLLAEARAKFFRRRFSVASTPP